MTGLIATAIAGGVETPRVQGGGLLPDEFRARLLLVLARHWDDVLTTLTPSNGDVEQAERTLLGLATALTHPAARDQLGPFLMPELRRLVEQQRAIENGDISHKDIENCGSYEEALADAEADVDYELWPLLSGRPTREACRGCRSSLPVHQWRAQVECTAHVERRVR